MLEVFERLYEEAMDDGVESLELINSLERYEKEINTRNKKLAIELITNLTYSHLDIEEGELNSILDTIILPFSVKEKYSIVQDLVSTNDEHPYYIPGGLLHHRVLLPLSLKLFHDEDTDQYFDVEKERNLDSGIKSSNSKENSSDYTDSIFPQEELEPKYVISKKDILLKYLIKHLKELDPQCQLLQLLYIAVCNSLNISLAELFIDTLIEIIDNSKEVIKTSTSLATADSTIASIVAKNSLNFIKEIATGEDIKNKATLPNYLYKEREQKILLTFYINFIKKASDVLEKLSVRDEIKPSQESTRNILFTSVPSFSPGSPIVSTKVNKLTKKLQKLIFPVVVCHKFFL